MRIIAVGVNDTRANDFKIHRPDGRSDYLFVLFKSTSKVMVDGEYKNAAFGSFIVFDKHKIQSYFGCGEEPLLHDFMHFDFDDDYERLLFSEIPKGELIDAAFPDSISNVLSEIKNEFQSPPNKYKTEILTNLGTAFLYRIKNEAEKATANNKGGGYFSELYSLRLNIYKNPSADWTIESMSRELLLSRSYFQYLYKNLFGVPCNEDVINARITYAKMLLTSTTLTVSDVAQQCGYSNTEHFIRQFKSRSGVSPHKFRNI